MADNTKTPAAADNTEKPVRNSRRRTSASALLGGALTGGSVPSSTATGLVKPEPNDVVALHESVDASTETQLDRALPSSAETTLPSSPGPVDSGGMVDTSPPENVGTEAPPQASPAPTSTEATPPAQTIPAAQPPAAAPPAVHSPPVPAPPPAQTANGWPQPGVPSAEHLPAPTFPGAPLPSHYGVPNPQVPHSPFVNEALRPPDVPAFQPRSTTGVIGLRVDIDVVAWWKRWTQMTRGYYQLSEGVIPSTVMEIVTKSEILHEVVRLSVFREHQFDIGPWQPQSDQHTSS